MTTVAILQSNYIPWRGYFDMIRRADHFVFYDDVQYTKNDWRNRNRIVGRQGAQWLTIPVETGGKFGQTIAEARINDTRWQRKHLMALQTCLGRGRRFEALWPKLVAWYGEVATEPRLSVINQHLIAKIVSELGISTTLHQSAELGVSGGQTERLVKICQSLGASRYLTGPAARNYLDEGAFSSANIAVDWMAYPEYPQYLQSSGMYDPRVSIVDCLAWCPPDEVFGN